MSGSACLCSSSTGIVRALLPLTVSADAGSLAQVQVTLTLAQRALYSTLASVSMFDNFLTASLYYIYMRDHGKVPFLNCSCVEETVSRKAKSHKDLERRKIWASAFSCTPEQASPSAPASLHSFSSVHLRKLKHISYPCNIIPGAYNTFTC